MKRIGFPGLQASILRARQRSRNDTDRSPTNDWRAGNWRQRSVAIDSLKDSNSRRASSYIPSSHSSVPRTNLGSCASAPGPVRSVSGGKPNLTRTQASASFRSSTRSGFRLVEAGDSNGARPRSRSRGAQAVIARWVSGLSLLPGGLRRSVIP